MLCFSSPSFPRPAGPGVRARLAAVLLALRGGLTPGAVVLTYHPRRRPATRVRGPLAQARHAALAAFFAHDLRPGGPVTVVARRDRGAATWRVALAGALTPAGRQRTRNALLDLLG
jgi:hypothetical protein